MWGYLAGAALVVGKLASCAAMALTFAHYVAPSAARPLALAAVAVLTLVNLAGIDKTVRTTLVLLVIVLVSLTVFVVTALAAGSPDASHLTQSHGGGLGVLRSGGILFFAFAGYARIATLGEEVDEPARTIPRAIMFALGLTVLVYAVVAVVALLAAPPSLLAATSPSRTRRRKPRPIGKSATSRRTCPSAPRATEYPRSSTFSGDRASSDAA